MKQLVFVLAVFFAATAVSQTVNIVKLTDTTWQIKRTQTAPDGSSYTNTTKPMTKKELESVMYSLTTQAREERERIADAAAQLDKQAEAFKKEFDKEVGGYTDSLNVKVGKTLIGTYSLKIGDTKRALKYTATYKMKEAKTVFPVDIINENLIIISNLTPDEPKLKFERQFSQNDDRWIAITSAGEKAILIRTSKDSPQESVAREAEAAPIPVVEAKPIPPAKKKKAKKKG